MIKRDWIVICCKHVNWKSNGMKFIKARPSGGKYLDFESLPEYVKLAFGISEETRCLQDFTDINMIPVFESHGANVSSNDGFFYKIIFLVESNHKTKRPNAYGKSANRNKYGQFLKKEI